MRKPWLQLLLALYRCSAGNKARALSVFKAGVLLLAVSVVSITVVLYTRANTPAHAATSSTINFQARLLSNTGAIVPDGTYNVEFKLYDSSAAGASGQGVCSLDSTTDDCWWVETRTGGNQVTVKNGYFSVNLGSVTGFGPNIPWDQELWLTLNIGGTGSPAWDGEMTPRTKLTAVPYAFKAGQLARNTGGNTSTLDFATQTAARTILLPDASGTVLLDSTGFLQGGNSFGATAVLGTDDTHDLVLQTSGTPRLSIDDGGSGTYTGGTTGDALTVSNSSSTGNIFVAQDNATPVFTIADGGGVLAKNSTDSAAAFQIQNTGNVPLFTADTTNSRIYIGNSTPDAVGALLVLDTKNDAGDPTGVNGGMYYNSSTGRFRCYQDNDWVDCIGGGSSGSATATFLSGLQNVPANATGTPVETLIFTSATAVSNTAGVTGFTAPADGSFRTCLIKNNAAITAGTLDLRWRVNGVSVGSSACQMDATNNRQVSSVLNPGVVNFSAGDTIGIAFDTSAGFLPVTAEFTVYWSVEYTGSGGGGGGGSGTLQDAYDNSVSASILAVDNKDIEITLPDTASDPNFIVNILSGSAGELKVQDNGSDVFTVNSGGDVYASGGLTIGDSALATAGTIRWTGLDFEGYDGSDWLSLTGGGGGGPGLGSNYVNIVKQANEVINNSIAPQDDNELQFSVGPNQEWTYRFVVQANAAAAADLRFVVTAPTGALCYVSFSDPEGATAGGQTACGVSSVSIPGNGAIDLYEITGSVTTGGTGGTVTLQWAQFTLNASDVTVYTGSYVTAFRSIGAGSSGQPFVQGGNSYGVTGVLGTTDAQELSIITDGTERILIDAVGNVGIGGDGTPAALLTVGTADAFQVNAAGNLLTTGTITSTGNINTTGGAVQTNSTTRIDNSGNLTNIGNVSLSGTISGGTSISGSGNINTTGGSIQTNSTTRIDNSGNLTNILALALTSSISGGTTYTGSGNINTTGGAIQTNSTTRIDNSGNLSNIGTINALGLATILGGADISGATTNINHNSNNNTNINTGTSTGTLTIGSGTANLVIDSTGLDVTSGGALSGITGYTQASGNFGFSGGGNFTLDSAGLDVTSLGAISGVTGYLQSSGNFSQTGAGTFSTGDGVVSLNGDTTVAATRTLTVTSGATSLTGATTGVALTVSNSSSTGNILTLNDNSTTVFSVADGGAVLARNSVNSQQAFQVQNSAGNSVFNINTLASGLNLLANSNLENNINGWFAKGTPTLGTPVWDNTAGNAQFGNATLELSTDALTDGVAYSYPLLTGTQYTASFWAKTGSGTATFIIGRQENGVDVETSCVNAGITTTWTQFSCTFTTANAGTNIYFRQSAAGTPTIFIDGVTLVNGATALNFVNPAGSIQVDAQYGNLSFNAANLGELQPSQLNSNSLPAARRYGASAYSNGYVYFTGGDNGGAQSTVYYSRVNADGSLGTFNTTTPLTTGGAARYGHTSLVESGYIYVIGGDTGGTAQSTVYYAKVNNDGTVASTWRTANPIPAAREFHSSVAINGYIYVIGGDTGGTAQSTVYYAKVNADGNVGTWQTGTALTTGAAIRRQHTSVFANGYLYVIGGYDATTAQSTVYYNTVNSDGSLGASWSSTTSLPGARRYATATVANGYMYVVGGCSDNAASCTTPTSTVHYSKINNNGTIGIWQQASNGLPAVRNGHAIAMINGYLYTLGGYNGTAVQSTVYYGSTPRTLFGGALDLVGAGSQTLSDGSGAGSITAGNIRAIGRLQVEGAADINGGLSVDSSLNINSVSAATGQVIFNVNNNTSNSIFDIKHMAANFGGLATTGAFVDRNSYWGEEFNVVQSNACSRTATTNTVKVRGDFGNNAGAACTTGNGSISFSTVEAGPGTPTSTASTLTGSYGVERLTSTGVVTAGSSVSSLLYLSTTAAGTINGQWAANNLPVFTAKVRPSLVNSGSNARFFVGLSDKGAATGTMPNNGIFFTNCSTFGATPTCTNTNWQGVVTSGGAIVGTVQACTLGTESGTINTTNFNYLRIEVRANNDVHFFVDTNTATGVSEVECGTGVTTAGPGATALTLMLESAFMTNTATTENLDIDFVRIWQDDPEASAESTSPLETLSAPTEETNSSQQSSDGSHILADLMNVTDPDVQAQNDGNLRTGQLIVSGEAITRSLTTGAVRINRAETDDSLAQLLLSTGLATNKGLVVQGVEGQSGNLFEAQNSTGEALVFIDANGRLGLGNADKDGGIVLKNSNNTFQTLLFTAGSDKDVSLVLPGEDGTLCVQKSGSCGFAAIGSETSQTDSSNFDSLSINKTTTEGNLLSLKRNGQGVLTVGNNGGLDIVSDNGAALEVHGTSGLSFFRVDTNGGLVQIGDSAGDDRGILLILDSKNTAGDPNGVNGASYYNNNANKFRCFQNGRWQDCLPSGYNQYTLTTLQQQWTDQPSAETELPSISHLFIDLSLAQEYRLVISRPNSQAAGGASCRVQYTSDESGTWTDLDEAALPGLAIDSTGTKVGSWNKMKPGAKAEVFLRVSCRGGDGNADPQFGSVNIQVR